MNIHLMKNETVSIHKKTARLNVSCLTGEIWLTQSGDINDYLLFPRMSISINCKSKVVMFAIEPATLILESHYTKKNGLDCNGMNLFYKITGEFFRGWCLGRRTNGQS